MAYTMAMALALVGSIFASALVGVKNNVPGLAGLWVALAGVCYMVGVKFMVKITLPVLLTLAVLKAV